MVLGDFNPISGLSGLSRSDHGHISAFFSQPSRNTRCFHRGVLILQQMTSFSGYFEGKRMCHVTKPFFGLSIIKVQPSRASWAVVVFGPCPPQGPRRSMRVAQGCPPGGGVSPWGSGPLPQLGPLHFCCMIFLCWTLWVRVRF